MSNSATPALGPAAGLCLGIWFSYQLKPELYYGHLGVLLGILILGLGLSAGRKISTSLYLALTIIAFFSFGFYRLSLAIPENQPSHYIHKFDNRDHLYEFKLVEFQNPTPNKMRWKARLIRRDGVENSGMVLITIPDSLNAHLWGAGDRIVTWCPLSKPRSSQNLHDFDYASYLATDNIYAICYLKSENYRQIPELNPTWKERLSRLRNQLIKNLEESGLSEAQSGLAQALLLGYKGLNPEQYANYQRAGASHILAVSGLHVGIFCAIMGWLLGPIRYLKYGRKLHGLLVILLLWGYVFLAGGGAAIFRAAVLFTLLTYAIISEKSGQSMHFWALAILFLLGVVNPLWLFHPGFLLSFSAVWSILMFYPKLYKIWPYKKGLLAYLGQLNCLGISAQLGVLPVSLYYFHQFPLHFLLSNIMLVPYLGIVLGWGYSVLIGLYFNLAPWWLISGFGWLLNVLNYLTNRLGNLDNMVITEITWGIPELMITLLGIVILAYRIRFGQFRTLSIALSLLLLLECYWIFDTVKASRVREWIIPHQTGQSSMWFRNGLKLTVFTQNAEHAKIDVTAYGIGERLKNIQYKNLQNSYLINKEQILLIDSAGIYPKTGYNPRFIVLSGSPKIHLGRVIETLRPEMIIADGSNYRDYLTRWEITCHQYNIPFYATATMGAFIKNIDPF